MRVEFLVAIIFYIIFTTFPRLLNVDCAFPRLLNVDCAFPRLLNVDCAFPRLLNVDCAFPRLLNVDCAFPRLFSADCFVLQDNLFACEYHGGYIALRDQEGLYLSPIGSRAVLKTRSNVVTKVGLG